MASKRQPTIPLLDIRNPAFAAQYEQGVWWSMYGEEQGNSPLSISYLKMNLKRYQQHHYFEQHDPYWRHHIGFYLGMYHGGVLSPQTGQLRPGVNALIAFDHLHIAHSYRIGREACFHEPGPCYRYSKQTLLAYLQKIVREASDWKEPEGIRDYTLGCLLGDLSGSLFPETPPEQQAWREAYHTWGRKQIQPASMVHA